MLNVEIRPTRFKGKKLDLDSLNATITLRERLTFVILPKNELMAEIPQETLMHLKMVCYEIDKLNG